MRSLASQKMSRDAKNMSKLFQQNGRFDMVLKRNRADLKDYSMQHKVSLAWDLNDEAIRDRIFKMEIDDDITLFLDLEEFLAYTRAM